MSKIKILKNVAYSFAQHCQSGLSFLHPHVAEKCGEYKVNTLCVQLYPSFKADLEIKNKEPLFLALQAATKKFFEILSKNKFDKSIVKATHVTFFINDVDNYNTKVCIKIETVENKIFDECIDFI